MGFCPELATRPLGAPTLILLEAAGKSWSGTEGWGGWGGVAVVRFSAADTVSGDGVSESSVGMVTSVGCSGLSADSHCAAAEVKPGNTRM